MLHVLLDTEVFHAENLDFASKKLQRLVQFVKEGRIAVYLTDFVIGEIHSAITRKVPEAVSLLSQHRTRRLLALLEESESSPLSGALAEHDTKTIIEEVDGRFRRLCASLGVVEVATDTVSISKVREMYFQGLPPFSGPKKKSEFPDAFSILAADVYAKSKGKIFYFVSADEGIQQAIERTAFLRSVQSLNALLNEVLSDEEPVAELIQNSEVVARQLEREIEKKVGEAFADCVFYVEDALGDVDDVKVLDVDLGDPTAVEVDDRCVTLAYLAQVKFKAWLIVEDPDRSVYDRETGNTLVFGHLERDVEKSEEVEVEVQIGVSAENTSESNIRTVDLSATSFGVAFPWD